VVVGVKLVKGFLVLIPVDEFLYIVLLPTSTYRFSHWFHSLGSFDIIEAVRFQESGVGEYVLPVGRNEGFPYLGNEIPRVHGEFS